MITKKVKRRGRNRYIPYYVEEELYDVKFDDNLPTMGDAFKRMAEYSRKGRTMLKNNKRGQIQDYMMLLVVLFTLSITVTVAYFVGHTVIGALIATPQINSSVAATTSLQGGLRAENNYDQLTSAWMVGSTLFLVISGWLVGGHLIWMVGYILFIVIIVAISPIISNVFLQIILAPALTASSDAMPITQHIMQYLPMYMAIIGVLGMIAMFAKPYMGRLQ